MYGFVRICEDLTGLNPVNFGDVLNGILDDDYLVGTFCYLTFLLIQKSYSVLYKECDY